MTAIKSFSDLQQSKKLAEILPLESADMNYWCGTQIRIGGHRTMDKDLDVPCWSLSALLDILPKKYYPIKGHETDLILGKPKDKWCILYWDATGMQDGEQTLADNPVDACYEMIIKLHEQKML